ncbi:MAG TPA: 16S rRNA (adenine(1518)-N(6)/adenine(1519)-N(6))-dimethyltransferase RsmA [Caulobacteraceae bacterium]|nr:16S rRNA (adenine(1518)-N(6)/adenine(1519)-N(6))-dimethyltransferase RsmA [Caulobacteraceae bacterium]
MKLDSLPPLRDGLAAHGLAAKRALGQHFLLDLNLTAKIARLAGPLENTFVIEVGPGPGGLTRALLAAGARVIAIERDRRFLPLLAELADAAEGRLQIVAADALAVDERALLPAGAPASVVANLPYNISAPLLAKWLTAAFRPASMTLMFQKEVAERIVAPAGAPAYGRISVLAQALASPEIAMTLPARAFTPPPKVDSAVVRFAPKGERLSDRVVARLEDVTRAAFGQRRKMLRSSLRRLGGEALSTRAGIDSKLRAEDVPVDGFLALARALVSDQPRADGP